MVAVGPEHATGRGVVALAAAAARAVLIRVPVEVERGVNLLHLPAADVAVAVKPGIRAGNQQFMALIRPARVKASSIFLRLRLPPEKW